ncbi:hypothetical protein Gohar_023754 [Gossypium harknessii]|uniref:Uncharacterized protein n=1 Tax=Gossypium harknessii TaxID=34285 RepID=A0A7J9HGE9_9ROSI|nr:hypothetical protein [Gossypium harknessii]
MCVGFASVRTQHVMGGIIQSHVQSLRSSDDSFCPESHDKGHPSNFKSKSWQLQLHGNSLSKEYIELRGHSTGGAATSS